MAAAAKEKGVEVMDACVTRGADRAQARELVITTGGAESTFEKGKPWSSA